MDYEEEFEVPVEEILPDPLGGIVFAAACGLAAYLLFIILIARYA